VVNPEAAVLAAAKDMLRRGLVEGTAGNISARREDGNLVITPSSVDYSDMTLDDLVLVDPDGGVLHAAEGRSPSTEMKLHLACYQAFDDIGSVIHSHPVWATMFAIAHQPIPACIDEFAIYCGGDIRCSEYAASATPEVGTNAVKALEGRAAALIANHGLVAVGPRPDKVLHVTALVERTAQIVWGQGLSAVQSRSRRTSTPTSPASTVICAPTRCSPASSICKRRRHDDVLGANQQWGSGIQ
jgi:L-fuculose-phosphate aldolase